MRKFEDNYILLDMEDKVYKCSNDVIDYIAIIYCDGTSGYEENVDLVKEFLEDNELGNIPTTAKGWLEILNELGEDWILEEI